MRKILNKEHTPVLVRVKEKYKNAYGNTHFRMKSCFYIAPFTWHYDPSIEEKDIVEVERIKGSLR